jgi:hypothetical protein
VGVVGIEFYSDRPWFGRLFSGAFYAPPFSLESKQPESDVTALPAISLIYLAALHQRFSLWLDGQDQGDLPGRGADLILTS